MTVKVAAFFRVSSAPYPFTNLAVRSKALKNPLALSLQSSSSGVTARLAHPSLVC